MNFSERFTYLCKEKGLSPSAAGNIMGFSRNTVSLWRKEKTNPNEKSLKRISEFFDVSADYLLGKSNIRNAEKEYSEKEKILLCVFGTTEVSEKAWNDFNKAIELLKKKHHIKQTH